MTAGWYDTPSGPDWRREGLAIVTAAPRHGDDSATGRHTIEAVRDAAHSASPEALVGCTGPLNADFIDAVYGSFPLMILLISVVTFLLLPRCRSPLRRRHGQPRRRSLIRAAARTPRARVSAGTPATARPRTLR